MNSKFKRLLACLLSFMMVVSLFPMSAITAFAEESDEIATVSDNETKSGTWGGIDWTLTTDGTLTIAPTKGTPTKIANKKTEFKVGEWPEAVRYNSKGAGAAIEGWPYDRTKVKKLIIEEGVTSIGSFAVQSFTNLTGEVVIPSTVTYIGQEAFQNSTMTKLTFAEGGTEALTIAQGGLKDLIIEELTLPADRPAIHLKAWVFNNCDSLKHITLPANVKSIGGTNMVDYLYFSTSHNSGNYSALTFYNDNLEAITFGSEAVRDLYFTTWGNPITTIGNKNSYKIAPTVANVGLTYATSLEAAARFAKSGDTITLLKDTDEVVELPAGVTLDTNGFTAANVTFAKPAVAQIGDQGFESLTKAIAAAQAGQTITFVADITEDVTISKAVTIDGAGKTYTGAMELKADSTIKNVNFDGKGYNGYAVNTRGAQYVTIEDCTVKNYGYGFAQLPSATALTTVKNVTVSGVNYGVKVDYSGAVVLENVDITAGVAAVLNSNYGEKTITIKDSKLNILGTWTRNNTTKTNYVFEGANTIDSFIIDAAIDTFKLAAGATLTAPNAVTVTTDVEDGTVVYEDGNYYVQTGLAGSGTQADPYQIGSVEDLVKFRDSVNAGETKYNAEGVYVVLTADIDLSSVANWAPIGTFDYSFDGNFNGQGHKIMNLKMSDNTAATGEAYLGFFGVTANNTVENFVIENVSIESNGQIVAAAIAYPYYTTVKDITVCGNIAIKGGHYTAGVLAYTRLCQNASNLTVSGNAGSYITGANVVGGVIADIQMNKGLVADYSNFKTANVTITGDKCVGGISGIIAKQTINGATVENVVLNCTDSRVGVVAGALGGTSIISNATVSNVNGATAIVGGAYDGGKAVQTKIGDKYYATFVEALAAVEDGDTLVLLADVELAEGVVVPAGLNVTLDLAGKTISQTKEQTAGYQMILNDGNLTINDSVGGGKISYTDSGNGGEYISDTIYNRGVLVINGGTIENLSSATVASNGYPHAVDTYSGLRDTSVTINGGTIYCVEYSAIRMFCVSASYKADLVINDGTIKGAVDMQNGTTAATNGSLTVNGGTFETTKNANNIRFANWNGGATEYGITAAINGGSFNGGISTEYVPAAANWNSKIISGGTFAIDPSEYVSAGFMAEQNSDGTYGIKVNPAYGMVAKVDKKYYASLQAAVDAANKYQTVVLLQNAEGPGVVINKKTTIDFAGFTYTLTEPVGSTGTKSNGFQILAGNYTVRLLNGTLKVADSAADKFYILVQNYSDLIVQKMTLDGTNLDKYAFTDGDSYTLSNNSGNVQINNAKVIANNDGDKAFAFDACDMSASGYALPSVLVYSSSTIEGKMETTAKVGQRYYATFEQAFEAAEEGKTITLYAPIVVKAGETLSLNKNVTINYTSSVAGEDMITNRGTVIVDGTTLVYNNKDITGSNVTVSTISCEPGSVLEVKSGVVKNNSKNNSSNAIYAYAIDLLTNGNLGNVTATISGGEVISSNYMAIRQFNNGEVCNNTLNVTGGYIHGAKRAIQTHLNNNAAYLTISDGKIEGGDYALCLYPENATNITVTGGEFIGAVYSGTNDFISGGIFQEAVYEGYVTESYKLVKTDNGYEVIIDEAYGSVATIGNNKYNSFATAWEAAQNGDTIVLQNNVAIDTETFTVADGEKITLDMNGYTITVTDNATKNYELFYIYGEMVVTGKGVIELTSTNNREWNAMSAIFHNRGGILTIENGTYTNLGGTDMAWVVDNSGNYYGDAITNINSGTLTSTYTAIRNRMEQNTHGASGKAILNINDGKIDGTTSAIWAQAASVSTVAPATGEINILGGEIGLINTARSEGAVSMTTITGGTVAGFKGESGELKVNGGKITGEIIIMFANGDVAEKTVVKSKVYYAAVAKMGSTYFATVADAIKKCTGAQSIVLLKDIEGEGLVISGKTVIDFNGHTYTVTAPVAGTNIGFQINASGKGVRLINGTLKAAENSGVEVLVENNANLTIQKQTLVTTKGKALVVKGGSVSINIATVNAENAVAIEVLDGKITVYSEGKSSFINGEKLAKKSGTTYVAK